MAKEITRIVGYCRVSTAGQAVEGVSLDAQKERIRLWCSLRGETFDPSDFHVDAGLSGGRFDNRPGLNAALKSACIPGGVLVVYSLSRLARSVRDTLVISEHIEKSGADLVSISEQIDTTSASGKMIFRLLAVMAEFERDLISERTKSALNFKRQHNERIGTVPFGRQLAGDGKTLVAEPIELQTIGLIAKMKQDGATLKEIAIELNRQKRPTKKGQPWERSTVFSILKRHEKVNTWNVEHLENR